MKQNKKEKEKEKEKQDLLFETSLKKAFDGVYQLITANGLFILMNLHILLVFVFVQPGNIVIFYILFGALSLNLAPSYAALVKTLKSPVKEEQQVMKDYFRFYQKSFLVSFGVGFLGIFFMVNALTIRIFLLSQGMGGVIWFFSGVFFIILVFTVMFTYLSGTLQLSLGKTIKLGAKHIVELLPGAVAALVIGLVGLFLGGVFRAFLILSFSLGAMVQTKLSEKTLSKINIRS